ncbi:MAG: ubiquinone/menaquinone biosynthesis methyltransferase [Verrucomicrobia bacterium]|nr:ubiquinone/menaquinone biosynthesis methyltransferase [Verrucomicrobiota bacterium]
MANRFYQPGATRAANVRDLFSSIARRYDLVNDLQSFGLHRCWKRKVAAWAAVGPGQRALDVCCGTGDVARALVQWGPTVVGVDFSGPMLEVAQRRSQGEPAADRGRPKPCWVRGDALRLPFADGSFDGVTISYGLRNLADFAGGLRELWRVTRPGGRIVVLDFGKPDHAGWRALFFAYLRWVVPWLGRCLCGNADAYAYILESLNHYPSQQAVADLVRSLPMHRIELRVVLGGVMGMIRGVKPA